MNSHDKSVELSFDDNGLAMQLFGPHHSHISRIESALDISIHTRGNVLTLNGEPVDVDAASEALNALYARLEKGLEVGESEVDAVLRMSDTPANGGNGGGVKDTEITVRTRKRVITPRSTIQAEYLNAIDDAELVFGQGPAGTGKTYLAVAKAVERLVRGDVDLSLIHISEPTSLLSISYPVFCLK